MALAEQHAYRSVTIELLRSVSIIAGFYILYYIYNICILLWMKKCYQECKWQRGVLRARYKLLLNQYIVWRWISERKVIWVAYVMCIHTDCLKCLFMYATSYACRNFMFNFLKSFVRYFRRLESIWVLCFWMHWYSTYMFWKKQFRRFCLKVFVIGLPFKNFLVYQSNKACYFTNFIITKLNIANFLHEIAK